MTDKDNIKLKTDTPSPRKSGSSIGVHVKRKRKIIAKPLSSQTPHSSRSTRKEEKKEKGKSKGFSLFGKKKVKVEDILIFSKRIFAIS